MKFIVTLLFSISYQLIIAQASYKIEYEKNTPERTLKLPMTIDGEERKFTIKASSSLVTLITNDSLGYLFTVGKKKSAYKDTDTIFGSKALHHHMFYNSKTNEVLHYSAYPFKRRPILLVDTFRNFRFQVLEDSVFAYNQLCSKAQIINAKNDTLFVLMSREVAVPFGPIGYMGLPGLVLEQYHLRTGEHIKLKSIQQGNYIIRIPTIRKEYIYLEKDLDTKAKDKP